MNHYSLKFLWADFRSSLEWECHLFSLRAKYTFPLENVHFLFCLCAQNNLMNIRLKGIGANITSSQTDWYTLPIILRKTSPQISFISLATIKWTSGMKTKGNTDTHRARLGWWVSLWLAWRRWAVYNWWRVLWVVTLLMSPGAGPVSSVAWCPMVTDARREEERGWVEPEQRGRTGDWSHSQGRGLTRPPLASAASGGGRDSTHHSLPSLGRTQGTYSLSPHNRNSRENLVRHNVILTTWPFFSGRFYFEW